MRRNADYHAGYGLQETAYRQGGASNQARGTSPYHDPWQRRYLCPAGLSPPSLALPQQSTGVYIPPPINNPSAQINQLNQSFPLNRGLGNNPTDRDAYIRYNLTR
jgi:hypothetical protein